MHSKLLLTIFLVFFFLLPACGQKGQLYLPEDTASQAGDLDQKDD